MPTLIHRKVEEARRGGNPCVIARMPSGWAVLGDPQVLPGYCLLLPDPVAATLNDLAGEARAGFLRDMAMLGDAVLEVTGATRINYEILGNLEPALHAHVIPRYPDREPAEWRHKSAFFYDWEKAPKFDVTRDAPIMKRIAEAVRKRI